MFELPWKKSRELIAQLTQEARTYKALYEHEIETSAQLTADLREVTEDLCKLRGALGATRARMRDKINDTKHIMDFTQKYQDEIEGMRKLEINHGGS